MSSGLRVSVLYLLIASACASPWVISKQNFHLEQDDKASFTLSLSSEPFNPVTVGVTPTDPALVYDLQTNNVVIEPEHLLFKPTNWNIPQKVTISANKFETPHVDKLTFGAETIEHGMDVAPGQEQTGEYKLSTFDITLQLGDTGSEESVVDKNWGVEKGGKKEALESSAEEKPEKGGKEEPVEEATATTPELTGLDHLSAHLNSLRTEELPEVEAEELPEELPEVAITEDAATEDAATEDAVTEDAVAEEVEVAAEAAPVEAEAVVGDGAAEEEEVGAAEAAADVEDETSGEEVLYDPQAELLADVSAEALVAEDGGACDDLGGWVSSSGFGCDKYTSENWCLDGDASDGWEPEFGTMQDWADEGGISALVACCECGGGVSLDPALRLAVATEAATVTTHRSDALMSPTVGAVVLCGIALSVFATISAKSELAKRKHQQEQQEQQVATKGPGGTPGAFIASV